MHRIQGSSNVKFTLISFLSKNGSMKSVYDVRNTPRCYCVIEIVHAKEFLWILSSFNEL